MSSDDQASIPCDGRGVILQSCAASQCLKVHPLCVTCHIESLCPTYCKICNWAYCNQHQQDLVCSKHGNICLPNCVRVCHLCKRASCRVCVLHFYCADCDNQVCENCCIAVQPNSIPFCLKCHAARETQKRFSQLSLK